MKKKIHKIMGVGLTLVLVITFAIGMGAPVAASPDTDEWEAGEAPFDLPSEGSTGDWFYDPTLADMGPIDRAINGDLYVYALIGSDFEILKSEDGGRTWSKTDYEDDLSGEAAVVAIVCSSIDADIVYAADFDNVYKTENGGGKWVTVSSGTMPTLGNDVITCLAVGYLNDEPIAYFGTRDTVDDSGKVHYLAEEELGALWTDLEIGDYDVYGIGTSTDFDNDTLVVAVIVDEDTAPDSTFCATNRGAAIGSWDTDVELETQAAANLAATEASDPVFPEDFDESDNFEYFVGVVGPVHTVGNKGGVYRVYGETSTSRYLLEDIDDDIISLDGRGDLGSMVLLAGVNDEAEVWASFDDGDNWDDTDKAPSGGGPTYVAMDEDFDEDAGLAWAVTDDPEGAVSLTEDGGVTFNQISLIDTDIDWVTDIALGSDSWVVTRDTSATTSSLFRNDGDWERVWSSSVSGGDYFDLVVISPESEDCLFVAGSEEFSWGTEDVYRTTDNGQDWDELRFQPDEIQWHDAFLVIDDDTLIVGGTDGEVHFTDRYGQRAWDTNDVSDDSGVGVYSIAASPAVDNDDTLICGLENSEVWISEDLGDDWDQVGDALPDVGKTFVAFDPGFATSGADGENRIYAAADDNAYKFKDVTDSDGAWSEFTGADGAGLDWVSGIAVGDDGTLYVLDYQDGNGMARSPDPYITTPVFELIGTTAHELDSNAELTNMQLASGSNIIYATDIEDAKIWRYEDTMAVSPTLTSPSNGSSSERVDSVTLTWREIDNADKYEIKMNSRDDFDGIATSVSDVEVGATRITGLEDGRTYYWKVRVHEGEPALSRWSDVWSFTTAMGEGEWNPFVGGVPESPGNGDTGVPLMPTFAWNAADWATGYEFVLADNPAFTSPIVSKTLDGTVYLSEQELAYSTSYYWKVRAVSATSSSEWGTAVFTTMAKAVPAPTPAPPVTVTPPAPIVLPTPIPPALLWTIIGIGALLIIAVIVLIIRTRRPV